MCILLVTGSLYYSPYIVRGYVWSCLFLQNSTS